MIAVADLADLTPAQRLDVFEAVDGPDPIYYKERRHEAADLAGPVAPVRLAPAPARRCGRCGYVRARCDCPARWTRAA